MLKELNPLLHSQLRLAIMSILMNCEEASFVYIKEQTQATAGNLSVQLDKLVSAGYITVEKKFQGKKPLTLCSVTDAGKKAFEEYENTDRLYIYRTGGDEFCVLFKGTQQEIDVCLGKLDRVTKEWKGKLSDKLSLSWGYAKCEDGDIDTAFRAADQMMYENKKIYYQQSGIERRRGV